MKFSTPIKAAVVASLAWGGAAAAQEYSIRATANSNEADEDADGLFVFKQYVEAASNGAIEVELFIGTQLCSAPIECLQGVGDGSIDIYIATSSGAAGIFPYVQIFDLPYLMPDDRIAETVLANDNPFVDLLQRKVMEDSDGTLRLMTIGNTGGWRNFANTQRRVAEPADMEGLKIRTVVADLPQELVKALGASPTPIPWPELFTLHGKGSDGHHRRGGDVVLCLDFLCWGKVRAQSKDTPRAILVEADAQVALDDWAPLVAELVSRLAVDAVNTEPATPIVAPPRL